MKVLRSKVDRIEDQRAYEPRPDGLCLDPILTPSQLSGLLGIRCDDVSTPQKPRSQFLSPHQFHLDELERRNATHDVPVPVAAAPEASPPAPAQLPLIRYG